MSKILIFVKGGSVQWTAGSPDIDITIVDADNFENNHGMSVSKSLSPDTCVPDDETFENYVEPEIWAALSDAEEEPEEPHTNWKAKEEPGGEEKPKVVDISGSFRTTTEGIIFSGTVVLENESGRRWSCSGEHSESDYDWAEYADKFNEGCPESPEIVELNDEEEAK